MLYSKPNDYLEKGNEWFCQMIQMKNPVGWSPPSVPSSLTRQQLMQCSVCNFSRLSPHGAGVGTVSRPQIILWYPSPLSCASETINECQAGSSHVTNHGRCAQEANKHVLGGDGLFKEELERLYPSFSSVSACYYAGPCFRHWGNSNFSPPHGTYILALLHCTYVLFIYLFI